MKLTATTNLQQNYVRLEYGYTKLAAAEKYCSLEFSKNQNKNETNKIEIFWCNGKQKFCSLLCVDSFGYDKSCETP